MLRQIGKYNVELYPQDIKDKNNPDIEYGLMIISVFVNPTSGKEIGRKQFYYHDSMMLSNAWMRGLTEAKVKEIYAKPQNTKFYFDVVARTGVIR